MGETKKTGVEKQGSACDRRVYRMECVYKEERKRPETASKSSGFNGQMLEREKRDNIMQCL